MAIPYFLPGKTYQSVEEPAMTMRVESVDEDDYVLVTYLTVGPLTDAALAPNQTGFLTQNAFDNPAQYWTPIP